MTAVYDQDGCKVAITTGRFGHENKSLSRRCMSTRYRFLFVLGRMLVGGS